MEHNWKNRTLWTGDNLDIMRGMNSGSVDLIYLDPPFNSDKDYAAPIGSQAAGAAFKDTWTLSDVDDAWHGEVADKQPALYLTIDSAGFSHSKSMKSYLIMMAVRLLEMKRILKDTGSIYLHCDPTAGHYLKMLMDTVFGVKSFRNEIIWKRTSSHNRAKRWGPIHDTLLFYSKGPKFTWNRELEPLSMEYVEKQYKHSDQRGRFRISDLTGPGERSGDTGQTWKEIDPTSKNRHWELPPDRALPDWFEFPNGYSESTARERLDVLDDQGLIYWPKKEGGTPGFKRYLTSRSGSPIQDIILDIKPLAAKQMENVDYPTQKPLALLDRIIRASSNKEDVVLDPFCGCATACVAADKLNRQWAGIDLSSKAVELVNKRLRDTLGDLYHSRLVSARSDIPKRTDMGKIPNYRTHKHVLYGRQGGHCTGCKMLFEIWHLTIDHVVPQSKSGTDHIENLQLLCHSCNNIKGTHSQAYLIAKLKRLNRI